MKPLITNRDDKTLIFTWEKMEVYKKFLVFPIDYKSKIAFLSLEDSTKSWTFDVDWSFAQASVKPRMFLDSNKGDEEIKAKSEEKSVHLIAIHEASDLIAITTNEKSVFICKIEENRVTTLSRRLFSRTTSSIKFSSCGKILFVADKTGDVFEYSVEDQKTPGKFLLGHISQILDLQVSHDTNYVITSDRDEKIRISNYPATHEIEAFCLGHLEFVSSVDFIDNSRLVSVSGDKSLKIWSFPDGKLQHSTELDFVPIIVKAFVKSPTEGSIFVSSDDKHLYIYEYNFGSSVNLQEKSKKEYPSDFDMATCNGQFYVKFIENSKVFIEHVVVREKLTVYKNLYEDISTVLNVSELSATAFKPFDVKYLFKSNKFAGKDEYMERKKARIEEIKATTKRQRKNHRQNVINRRKESE